jgi:hypothetical protein
MGERMASGRPMVTYPFVFVGDGSAIGVDR